MAGTSTKHLNAGWLTNTDLIGLDVFCCMSVVSLDVRVVECSYTTNNKQSAQTHHSNRAPFATCTRSPFTTHILCTSIQDIAVIVFASLVLGFDTCNAEAGPPEVNSDTLHQTKEHNKEGSNKTTHNDLVIDLFFSQFGL